MKARQFARYLFVLILHTLTSATAAETKVATDFPGGSAEVIALETAKGIIHIQPALHEGRGWPNWWYLRLDGLKPGQPVTLKVSAQPRPFRDSQRLAASWSQPDCAAISTDNVTWTQTPTAEMTKDKERIAIYRFRASDERVWLAPMPPFLPSHAEELVARIVKQVPDTERFVLARTRGGRDVCGLRIGSGGYGVWVQARQHAWEAGSSWVARGFIEWVAGDDAAAAQLRCAATIHFIPIMDVDNVTLGAGGKDATPRDQNRDWDDRPIYPEVTAAQRRIRELHAQGRLHVFLDLHCPGAGERRPYFYGPFDLNQMSPLPKRNYDRFLALAADCIRDPLLLDAKYHFATYVKTEEERSRMSRGWVAAHTAEHVVALCLETVWNTPHSTQAGYQAVGRGLAQALARYLAADPQRPVSNDR